MRCALALGLLLAACQSQTSSQTPSWRTAEVTAAEPIDIRPLLLVQPEPRADGFIYCCGNDDFKMAIDCNHGIKRCYAEKQGRWNHTYGRHCKRTLGEACYLTTCERLCSER